MQWIYHPISSQALFFQGPLGTSPVNFEGRHIDHRSSKVDTSISEGRHIDLRKSTHRSSKVDTSIFKDRPSSSIYEGRHIDHQSSKVDTSIFETRHIDLRRSWRKHRTDNPISHRQFVTKYCPQRRSIVLLESVDSIK